MSSHRYLSSLFELAISVLCLCFVRWNCCVSAATPALFVLGDSTVDVGNNNVMDTLPLFKVDRSPYGRRFFGKPTGRFSEGRVVPDFIADYAGLPFLPPYADREADFSYGANFASGGAGILRETNNGMVIDLETQLSQFVELHKLLAGNMSSGMEARLFFEDAVYLISIGSNDYLAGYIGNPAMQELYQPEQYVAMVVGNLTEAIGLLYSKGARKVVYLGLGPLGCLPALRMLVEGGGCLEVASALAQAHNQAIVSTFTYLRSRLQGLTLQHANFFDFLTVRLEDPTSYGFKEAVSACCGSGRFKGEFSCGLSGESEMNEASFEVCGEVGDQAGEEWVWWDAFHPSERIHQQFAHALWEGLSTATTSAAPILSSSSTGEEAMPLRHLFRTPSASLCSSTSSSQDSVFPGVAARLQSSPL